MEKKLSDKIYNFILDSGSRGCKKSDILKKFQKKNFTPKQIYSCIDNLRDTGKIADKNERLAACCKLHLQSATIVRVKSNFGYAVLDETQEDIFIPGRCLKGTLPNDRVLVRPITDSFRSDNSDAYEVISVIDPQERYTFLGVVTIDKETGKKCVLPDNNLNINIPISKKSECPCRIADKVFAVITNRGSRHSDLKAKILKCYGCSENAMVGAQAIIDANDIPVEFSPQVIEIANRINSAGISSKEIQKRSDFRNDRIFTIDSAESKDLDDAVSITKIDDIYILGVHIADVSHYVDFKGEIDKQAYERGTSIYYADKVIPMLPKALSNGICSLNPNEDRLTLSAIMTIDKNGNLLDYEFVKSIIRSKVKGVYSEINSILDGTASDEINQKYSSLKSDILIMQELADILTESKHKRGAPEIDKPESKIIFDENSNIKDITVRKRGKSEIIIEEFMLMANQAAAKASVLKQVPFVYRVHEAPSLEKTDYLKDTLKLMGLNSSNVSPDMSPKDMSDILKQAENHPNRLIINDVVLRSMSKARYSETPIGHYGLALEDYAHFTSPIRRYPDLTIHRILTSLIHQKDSRAITKKYGEFVVRAAKKSTDCEIRAMTIERKCEDCYKAEYMRDKIGQEFDAYISSVMSYGFYVQLENTIEGLIRISSLEYGEYQLVNPLCLKEVFSNTQYCLGDKIKVKCVGVNVNSGTIDFEPAK